MPIPDATILGPVEIAAITAISKIYGIDKEHGAERFKETIAEVGTVSLAAKGVLSLTKAIQASILRLPWRMPWLPEASLQHYVGLQSMLASRFILAIRGADDADWLKRLVESKLSGDFVAKVTDALNRRPVMAWMPRGLPI